MVIITFKVNIINVSSKVHPDVIHDKLICYDFCDLYLRDLENGNEKKYYRYNFLGHISDDVNFKNKIIGRSVFGYHIFDLLQNYLNYTTKGNNECKFYKYPSNPITGCYFSIIKNSTINAIKNVAKIHIYNHYYDLFINQQIIPFQFEYDIWRDTEMPQMTKTIIETIMELDLFASEIYNTIYQELI